MRIGDKLTEDLKDKAIQFIREDKPGPAIDMLNAVCSLNSLALFKEEEKK